MRAVTGDYRVRMSHSVNMVLGHQLVMYCMYNPICRYPAYVLNRLGQLSGATGENAVKTVCQLLYLSTLVRLYLQNSKDLSKRGE